MIALYIALGILAWLGIGVLITALLVRLLVDFGLDTNSPADWLFVALCVFAWPGALGILFLGVIGKGLTIIVDRLAGV